MHTNANTKQSMANKRSAFMSLPDCITTENLAKFFGVHKITIRQWEINSTLPKARINNGRSKIWFIEDLIDHFDRTASET